MSIRRADEYWEAFFGIAPGFFQGRAAEVVVHHRLGAWSGVWFFVRRHCRIISAPPDWIERLRSADLRLEPPAIVGPDSLRRLFGDRLERTIGPSHHAVLHPEKFRRVDSAGVRRLAAADRDAVDRLRQACSAPDWEFGAPDPDRMISFGAFDRGRLVALGGLRELDERTGDPMIVVHPDFRGRGHATAVVSTVVEHGLREDRLILYQTLSSNLPAVQLAARLGFDADASHLAVRLIPAGH